MDLEQGTLHKHEKLPTLEEEFIFEYPRPNATRRFEARFGEAPKEELKQEEKVKDWLFANEHEGTKSSDASSSNEANIWGEWQNAYTMRLQGEVEDCENFQKHTTHYVKRDGHISSEGIERRN